MWICSARGVPKWMNDVTSLAGTSVIPCARAASAARGTPANES
jgi:hypothetical protein